MEVGLLKNCPPEIPFSKMCQGADVLSESVELVRSASMRMTALAMKKMELRAGGPSGLAVSIEIISTLILAPREDIMYSMQLLQRKTYLFPMGNRGFIIWWLA